MDLLIHQEQLQKEGQEVLEKLDLVNLLSRYGEVELVGSFVLGLMTWRDIDILIGCKNIDRDDLSKLSSELIKKCHERIDISFIDNNKGEIAHRPVGIYFGISYYPEDIKPADLLSSNEKKWKIDCWFVSENGLVDTKYTSELKDRLTDESREIILEIKKEVTGNKKYGKEIFSVDIYDAVLDEGVKDLEGFIEYLKKANRDL